jgi:hypothetical protein
VATFRHNWFGLQVILSDGEVNTVIGAMNGGSGIAALVAAAGLTIAPSAVTAAIVSAILNLGAASLGTCNSAGRGIIVTVLWIGLPWCKSR